MPKGTELDAYREEGVKVSALRQRMQVGEMLQRAPLKEPCWIGKKIKDPENADTLPGQTPSPASSNK